VHSEERTRDKDFKGKIVEKHISSNRIRVTEREIQCISSLASSFKNYACGFFLRGGGGTAVSTVVKFLCYKSVGRWFDPSWCQWILH